MIFLIMNYYYDARAFVWNLPVVQSYKNMLVNVVMSTLRFEMTFIQTMAIVMGLLSATALTFTIIRYTLFALPGLRYFSSLIDMCFTLTRNTLIYFIVMMLSVASGFVVMGVMVVVGIVGLMLSCSALPLFINDHVRRILLEEDYHKPIKARRRRI